MEKEQESPKKHIPLVLHFDCDPDVDDTAAFYSKQFGRTRLVIIPKELFECSETPTTFVMTLKNDQ